MKQPKHSKRGANITQWIVEKSDETPMINGLKETNVNCNSSKQEA